MLGDVLLFSRGSGGHVGIYVGEDEKCYHVLGGNQGDAVSIVRIQKVRCIGIRRTDWSRAQPSNVRVIRLSSNGVISNNER
jgi:cell wall-associated NlpC family hydrolase